MPRGNQNFRQAHAGTPTPAGASGGGVKVIVESHWVLWLVCVCVCVFSFPSLNQQGVVFNLLFPSVKVEACLQAW